MATTTKKASMSLLLLASSIFNPCLAALSSSVQKTCHECTSAYSYGSRPQSNHSTFNQLIDHKNPSLGKFSQFYYYSDKYWKGPGSPIILTTPGETPVARFDAWFHEDTIYDAFAKATGGALIILEHRYYGHSSPYANLTAKTLQHMTLDNAIADLTYFAENVKLPFDQNRTSIPSKAAWVLAGGSYAGSLSAWTERLDEGTFWAFHASSAPVQAVYDFWQYFNVIETFMPRPCFDAVSMVVKHVDEVISSGDKTQIETLKRSFGLEDLKDNGDFASALGIPIYYWQSYLSAFNQFCNYLETGSSYSHSGSTEKITLTKAMERYGKEMKYIITYYCRSLYGPTFHRGSAECLKTDDPKSVVFTDTSVSNPFNRQWYWMLCNQPFAWWQSASPGKNASIISKFLTPEYYQRQCPLYFPEVNGFTFGSADGKTVNNVNTETGGWTTTKSNRLLFVNGQWDPWRQAGVSSDYRPDGPLNSTKQVPIFLIPKGDHVADLFLKKLKPDQKPVVDREISQMKSWVADYPKHGYKGPPKNGVGHIFDSKRSTGYALVTSLLIAMTVL